jgi:DNA-binding NtrC family response regulator
MRRIDIDRRVLRMAIVDAHGFVQRAAKALGVSRYTITRRLEETGLDAEAEQWRKRTGWRFGTGRGYGK